MAFCPLVQPDRATRYARVIADSRHGKPSQLTPFLKSSCLTCVAGGFHAFGCFHISYGGNPTNDLKEYWVNSGGIDILQSLALERTPQDRETMEVLLSGDSIRQDVSDNMPLRDLDSFPEALYSLLLWIIHLKEFCS